MGCCVAIPDATAHNPLSKKSSAIKGGETCVHDRRRNRRARFAAGLTRTGFRFRLKRSRRETSPSINTNTTTTQHQHYGRNSNNTAADEFITEPFDEPIGSSELLYASQCANLDRLYSNYTRSSCGYNTYGSQSSSSSSDFDDTSEDEEGNVQQIVGSPIIPTTKLQPPSLISANEKGGGGGRGEYSKAQKELPLLIVATTTENNTNSNKKQQQQSAVSITNPLHHSHQMHVSSSSYQHHHSDEEYASMGGFAVGEKVMVQANIPAPKYTYYSGINAPVSRQESSSRNMNEVHVVGDPEHPCFMMHIASLATTTTTLPTTTTSGEGDDEASRDENDDTGSLLTQGWIQRLKPWQREQFAEFVANVQQTVMETTKFVVDDNVTPVPNMGASGYYNNSSGLEDGAHRGRCGEYNHHPQHAEGLLGNPTTINAVQRPPTTSPIITPQAHPPPPPPSTDIPPHSFTTTTTKPTTTPPANTASYLGKWRKVTDSLIGIASDTTVPSCSQTFSVLEDGGGATVHRYTCPAAYGHTKDLPPFLSGLLRLLEVFHNVDNYHEEGPCMTTTTTTTSSTDCGGGLASHLNDFFGQFPGLFPPLSLVTDEELTAPNDRLGAAITLSVTERRNLVLSRLSELIADAFIAADEMESRVAGSSPSSPPQTGSSSSDILPGFSHHNSTINNNNVQYHISTAATSGKHDSIRFLAESTEQALLLLGQLTELGQPSIVVAEKQQQQQPELLQTSRLNDNYYNPPMELAKCCHNSSSDKRVSVVAVGEEQITSTSRQNQLSILEGVDNSRTLDFHQRSQDDHTVNSQRPSYPSGNSAFPTTNDSLGILPPNMTNHNTKNHAPNPFATTMAASVSSGILTPRGRVQPPHLKDSGINGEASSLIVSSPLSASGGASVPHSTSNRKSLQGGAAVSFSPAESLVVREISNIAGDVSEIAGASFSAVTTTITKNGAIPGLEALSSVPGYHTGTIIGIRDAVGTYGVYEMVTERLRSSASILHRRRRRRARRRERAKGANSNNAVVLSPTKPNTGPPTLFGINRSINNTMGDKSPDSRMRLGNQQQPLPPTNIKTVAMPMINTASARGGGVVYPGANPLVPHSAQRAKTLQWALGDESSSKSTSSDEAIIDDNSSVSSGNLSTHNSTTTMPLFGNRQQQQHRDTAYNNAHGGASTHLLRGGATLWSVHAQPTLDLLSPLPTHPRFEDAVSLATAVSNRRQGGGVPKYGFMDGYTDNDNAASSEEDEGNAARLLLFADSRRTSIDGKTVEGGPNRKFEKRSRDNSICSFSTNQQLRRRYSVNQQHSTFVPSATTDNRRHHRPAKSQWWIEHKAGTGGAVGKLQSRAKIANKNSKNGKVDASKKHTSKKMQRVDDPYANWDWCFQHHHDEAGERICGVHVTDEFRSESSEASVILSTPIETSTFDGTARRMSRSIVPSVGTTKSENNTNTTGNATDSAKGGGGGGGGTVGRSTSLEQLSPPRFGKAAAAGARGSTSGSNASPVHPSIYRQCLAKVILQKRNPTVVIQLDDGSVLENVPLSDIFKLIHAAPPQGGRRLGEVPPLIPRGEEGGVTVRPIVHTAKTRGGILLQRERLTHVLAFLDELSAHIVSRKFPTLGANNEDVAHQYHPPTPFTALHHQGGGRSSGFPTPTLPSIMASPLSIVHLSQCLWENGCYVVGDRVALSTSVGDFTGTVTYSWPRELAASSAIQHQQDVVNRPIITPFCPISMTPALIQFSIVEYHHPSSGGSGSGLGGCDTPFYQGGSGGGPSSAYPLELPPQSPPRPRLGTVPPGHSGSLRGQSGSLRGQSGHHLHPSPTLETWLGEEEAEVMNLSNPCYDVGMTPVQLSWDCVTQSMLEALISTLRLPDSSSATSPYQLYDPVTGAATTPNVNHLKSASTLPQGASLGARPELENTLADHPADRHHQLQQHQQEDPDSKAKPLPSTTAASGAGEEAAGGGARKLSMCSSMFQAPLNDTKSSNLVPLFGPGVVCEASAVASVSTESTSIPNLTLTPVTEEVWSLRRYIIPLVFISNEDSGKEIESLSPKSTSTRVCIASDVKRNNVPCSTLFSSIMTSPFLNPAIDDLTHSTDTGAWMYASSSNTNNNTNRRPSGGLHMEWSVGAMIAAFTQRLRILVNLYLRAHPIVISIPRPLWPSLHTTIVTYISNSEPSKVASRPLTVMSNYHGGRLPKVSSFNDDLGNIPASDASGTTAPDTDLKIRSGSAYSSGTFNPNDVSASSGGSKRLGGGDTKLTTSAIATATSSFPAVNHLPPSSSSPPSSQRAGTLRFIAEQASIGRALPASLNGGQHPVPYAPMHSELAIRAFRIILMRMLRRMTHIMTPPQERRYSVHTLIGDHFQSVPHSDISLLDDD